MDSRAFQFAIAFLRRKVGLRLPYGVSPGTGLTGGKSIIINVGESKAIWDAYVWGGPGDPTGPQYNVDNAEQYATPDLTASPKPTWEELVRAAKLAPIFFRNEEIEQFGLGPTITEQTEAAALTPVGHGDAEAHVGSGLPRMPSLHYLHGHTSQAGELFRRAVLRNREETGTLDVGSRAELEEILKQIADNNDLAESASNILVAAIKAKVAESRKHVDRAADTTLSDAERDTATTNAEAAKAAADKLTESFEADLATTIVRLRDDSDWLPDNDTERTKAILIERLGAAANRARKRVIDADNPQESFFEAACNEQERALKTISQGRQAGNNRIREAATKETAEAAYRKAVEFLFAIPVDNSPIWIDGDGDPYIPGRGGFVEIPLPEAAGGRRPTLNLKVRNPHKDELKAGRKNLKLLGNPVVFLDRRVRGWSTFFGAADDEGERTVTLTWGRTTPLKVGDTVTVSSRNACGQTDINVKFIARPPAEPPAETPGS